MRLTTQGIVLRETNYKEADKKFQEAIKMTKILAVSSLESGR